MDRQSVACVRTKPRGPLPVLASQVRQGWRTVLLCRTEKCHVIGREARESAHPQRRETDPRYSTGGGRGQTKPEKVIEGLRGD